MESIKINLNIQRFAPEGASTANLGINQEKIQEIYNEIHTHIVDDAAEALNDLTPVWSAIEANWSGADAKVFYANLITLKNEIITKLGEYDDAIKNEFQIIASQWNEFQENHISSNS